MARHISSRPPLRLASALLDALSAIASDWIDWRSIILVELFRIMLWSKRALSFQRPFVISTHRTRTAETPPRLDEDGGGARSDRRTISFDPGLFPASGTSMSFLFFCFWGRVSRQCHRRGKIGPIRLVSLWPRFQDWPNRRKTNDRTADLGTTSQIWEQPHKGMSQKRNTLGELPSKQGDQGANDER
jgi:hypothetical protein